MTIKTPPTWNHELTPAMNGGSASNGMTYISAFAIHPFCSQRREATVIVIGCGPGNAGTVPPDSGVMTVMPSTSRSTTIPSPQNGMYSSPFTSVDGYPATSSTPDDAQCTSLGGPETYSYQVTLWAPAEEDLDFCINGPHIERLEAVIRTIAESASFHADAQSTGSPGGASGETIASAGVVASSTVPYCTNSEVAQSISAHATTSGGRTTFELSTTLNQATSTRCGIASVETCGGGYGNFAVFGPSRQVLWTFGPTQLTIPCLPGVWLLPVTLTVPSWSVPTTYIPRGTYTVRIGYVVNGHMEGPVLATTTFNVG